MGISLFADQDTLEPLALFVRANFARYAYMVDGRHVHEKPARQRDMAGNPGALLRDGFLGDLNQDLLAFFKELANGGHGGALNVSARVHATFLEAAAPSTALCGSTALRPLLEPGGGSRSADLGAVGKIFVLAFGFRILFGCRTFLDISLSSLNRVRSFAFVFNIAWAGALFYV